jgi:hypothetical protein
MLKDYLYSPYNIVKRMDGPSFQNKLIIGNKEKIEFPDLKRRSIVARIDSGAQSSSAHCDKIWVEKMGGQSVLCCHFLKRSRRVVRFEKYQKRRVKSSNGIMQTRYVVQLKIRLNGIERTTDVTLTDRSTMNYTVLLGRRFLRGKFLIDVSRSYLQSKK